MDIAYLILSFIAGIGALLYSVKVIGQAVSMFSGDPIKNLAAKMTNNRFSSFSLGVGSTLLFQSSTATILLVVGFVDVGIISLGQSLGAIMGANVGSALRMFFLLSEGINFNIIFMSLITLGVFIYMFSKKNTVKNIGLFIVGFGIMFMGLYLMSESMLSFKKLDGFNEFLSSIVNPAALLLVGIVFSMLVPSAMAGMAILIPLVSTTGGAVMSVESAFFIIYGINFGITIMPFITSLDTSVDSKRSSLLNVLFNLFGLIIFTALHFTGWTKYMIEGISNGPLSLILMDIIFNSVTTILLIGFTPSLAKLLKKLLKSKKGQSSRFEIDENLMKVPSIAVHQLGLHTALLSDKVAKNIKREYIYLFTSSQYSQAHLYKKLSITRQNCKIVENNLLKIMNNVNDIDKKKIGFYLECLSRLNSIVQKCERLVDIKKDNEVLKFTDKQKKNAKELFDKIDRLTYFTTLLLNSELENTVLPTSIHILAYEIDEEITKIKLKLKKDLVKQCDNNYDSISKYIRIINEFEQIGEHYTSLVVSKY